MSVNIADFRQQLMRLLRESWPSAQILAEEAFAVLNQLSDSPDSGPQTLTGTQDQPPLTLDTTNGDLPAITINSPDGTPAGGVKIVNGKPVVVDKAGNPTQSGGGGGVPAQVQSGGPGSGPYVVLLYPQGTGAAGILATASQLQIANSDTVPPGTWTLVTTVNGANYMQVPVWM